MSGHSVSRGTSRPLLVDVDLDQAGSCEHRDELRHLGVGGAWAGSIRAGSERASRALAAGLPSARHGRAERCDWPQRRPSLGGEEGASMRRSIPLGLAAAASLVAAPGAYATFPGDAGLLVFTQETAEGSQLFTMPASGGEPVQITHVEPVGRRRVRPRPTGRPTGHASPSRTRVARSRSSMPTAGTSPSFRSKPVRAPRASTSAKAIPRSRRTARPSSSSATLATIRGGRPRSR